jgi:hypothetical protein
MVTSFCRTHFQIGILVEYDWSRTSAKKTSTMSSAQQKKLLKKKRKEARRQASTTVFDEDFEVDAEGDTSVVGGGVPPPPQARRAMNIVNGAIQDNKHNKNLSARVSKAFDNGEWDEAFGLLFAMRYLGQVPKLGTLQVITKFFHIQPTYS